MQYKWKVCVLGDASVGKTSLVRHYCEGFFRENYLSTIGVSFLRKEFKMEHNGDTHNIVLQLWDLGGQAIFSAVRKSYLRGTNGALILFDLTNKLSLSHVSNWYEDVYKSVGEVPVLVIGNKSDLDYNPNVEVKAKKLIERKGLDFFKTSAKTGNNMNKIFELLAQKNGGGAMKVYS